MSLLLLLKPHGAAGPVTPTELPPAPPGRSKRIEPPQYERFIAETARIYLRATQPDLLLVPTAQGGTVRLQFAGATWEQRLESQAKKTPVLYRAARDDSDFDELVQLAYLLTRDPL